jgi:2-oxo-4-hydroxy-4-carboxy-5-ureidoimidazoline decarboxylase
VTLDDLNSAAPAAFVAALAGVCERRPDLVGAVVLKRPFASLGALHAAIMAAVAALPEGEKLAFLRAHPDLAGRAARAGSVTRDSASEQVSAGLDRLSDEEYARFDGLNRAYREKFGFPFIIAVRRQTKDTILGAFEARLEHDRDVEIDAAIVEVGHIIRLRLETLLPEAARGQG